MRAIPVHRFILLLFFAFICSRIPVSADPISDSAAIRIADAALLGIPFGSEDQISVVRTNGAVVVTFPSFLDTVPTNMPRHAAIVWIDEGTSAILPNPGLVSLSDLEAIQIATNRIPIPFDHSKTVRVDRASSLTRVTLPSPDLEIAPGVFSRDGFASKIWIDTQTKTVVGIEIPAD